MDNNKIVNLVLEGGGVKGIGLVGAITKLEEKGYSWNYIGGTSAGAIVATLLAVGYTGKDLYKFMTETKIRLIDIMDDESIREDFFKVDELLRPAIEKKSVKAILFAVLQRLGPIWRLFQRLLQNHGLFNGKYVVDEVRELIRQRTGNNCFTFADLAKANEASGGDGFKLSLMVTDITNGELIILPRDLGKLNKSPEDTEIVEAMRMSMSFPLFFKPVEVSLPGAKKVLLMDGGILSNFPFWYIDELTEKNPKPHPTIGILLDEGPREGITNLWGILEALLYTMISPLDRMGHRALEKHIVSVDTKAKAEGEPRLISTFAFDLPKTDIDALYDNGRRAATNWMEKPEKEITKEKPISEELKDFSRQKVTTTESA